MTVTLTPNPSVDRTVCIDTFEPGRVIRSTSSWSEPSGKGVNVALALAAHGRRSTAVLPIGGPAGAQLADMLDQAGLSYEAVPISGDVRVNISLSQSDGVVTKINESGPELTDGEGAALLAATRAHTRAGDWLAGCGSLPRGLPDTYYAQLVEEGHRAGATVVIDTSGPSLLAALAAGPDLIKPNTDELAEAVSGSIHTLGDVIDAAHELRARGARAVLVSLGADGALLVSASHVRHGTAPVDKVVSTVGAGDALLAGYLSVVGDTDAALRTALSWAASAVQHHGTLFTTGVPVATTLTDTVRREHRLS